jgi:hypothetical protein
MTKNLERKNAVTPAWRYAMDSFFPPSFASLADAGSCAVS